MIGLSVLIPAYNSEKTIGMLVKRLISLYGQRYDLQVITVNDGSDDGTEAVCVRLQEEFPEIVTHVTLSRNFGEHNAVMAGLHHVSGDYCVIMDDDLQNPPEEVQKLVDEIQKGYDVVYSAFEVKRHVFWRNLGSRINDRMANIFLGKPRDLYLSSFKAVTRFLIHEIIRHTGPDPYIDGIILRSTRNIGRVVVTHDRRTVGRSGYTIGKLIALWGNMVVNFSLLPVRLLGILGVLMFAFGMMSDVLNITKYLLYAVGGQATAESESMTNIMFTLKGIELIALSIVGEYVGRIYRQMNKAPQFVVRETRHRLSQSTTQDSGRTGHAG